MSRHYAAVDAARLPALINGRDAPIWWGMIGLITVESTLFAALISAYFYLGFGNAEWPLPGVKDPGLLLPTIGTVALLASSVSMHYADRAVQRGQNSGLRWGLGVSIVLAAAFLALKGVEYGDKDYRWHSHAYGSIVWLVIFFHSTHVVSLLLKTTVVALLAARGFFDRENRIAVTINGFYWHFVVAVWIPLYTVLYLSPRLGGA